MLRRLFNLFLPQRSNRQKDREPDIPIAPSVSRPYNVNLGGKHSRAKHKKGRDLTKNHPCGIVHINQHREDGRRMRHV